MIKRIVIGFALLLMALTAFVYFLLTTSKGLQVGLIITGWLMPGELQVKHAKGRILDHGEFEQVSYKNGDFSFHAQHVSGQWTLRQVIKGNYDIKAQWQDLTLQIGKQHIAAKTGLATLVGDSSHYQFSANTSTSFNQQTSIPWVATAIGKDSTLLIKQFTATLANNQASITGLLDWRQAFSWNLTLKMAHFDPALLSPQLSGNIHLNLQSKGNANDASIDLIGLKGIINKRNITAKGLIHFVNNKMLIKALKLYYGDARISVDGTLSQQWPLMGNLHWQALIPNMHIFDPNLYGQLEAFGQVTGNNTVPSIQAKVIAKQLKYNKLNIQQAIANLTYHWNKDGKLQLNITQMQHSDVNAPLKDINASATWQPKGQGMLGQIKIIAGKNPPITGTVALPRLKKAIPLAKQPIKANLDFQLSQLQFLDDYFAQMKDINGKLEAKLAITGLLGQPKLLGQVQLRQGQVSIPELGLNITKIQLNATSEKSGDVTYLANLNSGQGQLSIKGKTNIFSDSLPTQLTINGQNVEIMHNHQATLLVDPQISIDSKDRHINVEGTITIPSANITPDDFTTTETLPDDVVFVDEKQTQAPFVVTSRIHLILGKKVLFSYAGIKTKLQGELRLVDKSTGITTASGQLSVAKGQYKAYGTILNITHGQLIFSGGPVTNPALSFEATKQVRNVGTSSQTDSHGNSLLGSTDVTVGVQVTGTVNKPRLTLFSRPGNLKQSEILSYLLLNRSTDELSTNDASILYSALPYLSSGEGNAAMIKSQLEHKLGVNINVGSTQEYDADSGSMVDNTSLILGKSLSPKLFINYGIGLVKPINTLHIGYKVTKNFTIRTESNTNANGIDVLYTFER